jgi:sporulation protein YlmC with PRC-barrel domain
MSRKSDAGLPLSPDRPADMDADRNPEDGGDLQYEECPKSYRLISAGNLVGYQVRNADGEELGKIEEILLDVSTGVIACAVLSFGSFPGMGRKLYPIPWAALTLDAGNQSFTLNLERDKLQQVPGFDRDEWPNVADPQCAAEVFGYYGHGSLIRPASALRIKA